MGGSASHSAPLTTARDIYEACTPTAKRNLFTLTPSLFSRRWLLPLVGSLATAHAQISLFSIVDLARRNSAPVKIAEADVARANAAVSETRDVYVPSLSVGSSAGYSYGFPVGQPTIISFDAHSLVVSFSQPDYIRSARAALNSANLNLRDSLDQVELDTALDYLQLNTMEQQIGALEESKSYADRLDAIEGDRLTSGVESEIAVTRARLTAAQSDLKRLDLLAQTAVLRARLGNLTGLPEDTIEPEPESVPGPPINLRPAAPKRLASVDAAFSNAVSKHYVAHGDSRQNLRPQVGFGFSYQVYDTSLNNYNLYYRTPLQANNFSVGVQFTLPVFDEARTAHARGSAADALHADRLAEQARQQSDEAQLQLEKSIATLAAQARIGDLQAKLAAQQLQAVLLESKNPPAGPAALPVTPVDEMEARINERARFTEALDAHFALLKAQLSLLRTTGGLSEWINRGAR